jgi:hypothetical protein
MKNICPEKIGNMICMNIKSKHYKNIQCTNKATHGEYCKKHSKNPIRFLSTLNISASVIQKFWRKYINKKKFSRQGPAIHYKNLANNNSEIYSLESINTIPNIYFYSFSDSQKNIWAFDIRTLSYLVSKSTSVQNPYTRENISPENILKIKKRINWLKMKKYTIMYNEATLTNEQIWNQNILNVFIKMEESGYLVNPEWFHEMDKEDHILFYRKLYDIWNYRIGLSVQEKNKIVPGFNRLKLFKHFPTEILDKEEKYLKKMNLVLIQKLVDSASDKSQKSLGVMYVLMGLCYVCESVAEAFPWIYASII